MYRLLYVLNMYLSPTITHFAVCQELMTAGTETLTIHTIVRTPAIVLGAV